MFHRLALSINASLWLVFESVVRHDTFSDGVSGRQQQLTSTSCQTRRDDVAWQWADNSHAGVWARRHTARRNRWVVRASQTLHTASTPPTVKQQQVYETN